MLVVSTTGWALTIGLIGALLALDFGLSARRPHAVGFGEAAAWSVFYVAVALGFGVVLGFVSGWEFGGQFSSFGYGRDRACPSHNRVVDNVIIMGRAPTPALTGRLRRGGWSRARRGGAY